jgi:hypothetical protein
MLELPRHDAVEQFGCGLSGPEAEYVGYFVALEPLLTSSKAVLALTSINGLLKASSGSRSSRIRSTRALY